MGILLLIAGLGAVGFGVWQHFKGQRILAAPFRKTGEIANNPVSPDPKQMMSTEGTVVAPQVKVLSPLSKTECLYSEVVITRKWEKQERTQDGYKTVKGTSHVSTLKAGAVFGLDDGSGVVLVDATKGGDFDNLKKHSDAAGVFMSDGYLKFGELRIPTPPSTIGDHTLGFEAVEKLVPVGGSLFALGKLDAGKLTKPGWRSMLFSAKGRDGLLASTAKKKKVSFIGGAVGALAAIPVMLFAPASPSNDCAPLLTNAQAACTDNVKSTAGNDYAWTIDAAGPYAIEVTPPKGKKRALDPQVVVKDEAGDVVADEVAERMGEPVTAKVFTLKPGRYVINVKDVGGDTGSGGFDYTLAIRAEARADELAAKPMLREKKPEPKTVAAVPTVKVKVKPRKAPKN